MDSNAQQIFCKHFFGMWIYAFMHGVWCFSDFHAIYFFFLIFSRNIIRTEKCSSGATIFNSKFQITSTTFSTRISTIILIQRYMIFQHIFVFLKNKIKCQWCFFSIFFVFSECPKQIKRILLVCCINKY